MIRLHGIPFRIFRQGFCPVIYVVDHYSVISVAMGGDVGAIGAGVMQHDKLKAALGVDGGFMGGKQPVKLEHGYCVERVLTCLVVIMTN